MRVLWPRLLSALLLLGGSLSACDCGVEPLQSLPGRVAGVVCDELTGLPASGVSVDLLLADEEQGFVVTDDNGSFLLDRVQTGSGEVIVHGSQGDRRIPVTVSGRATSTVADPACRDVPPGPGFGDIVGKVCNRHTGSLVSDATVTVVLDDGSTQETRTDQTGVFQLWNVPVGKRVVVINAPGYRRSFLLDVLDQQVTELPSEASCRVPGIDEGLLSGIFCDAESDSGFLVGARVDVTDALGEVHNDITDNEGSFVVGPLPVGRATVHVTRSDDVDFTVTALVAAGGVAQVTNGGACVNETCQEHSFPPAPQTQSELMMIVDRSGSMTQLAPGYPGTRWEGVRTGLQSVTARLEQRVAFGLMLFPSRQDNECGAGLIDVEPAFENAAAISAALDAFASEPLGATPTSASLQAVRLWLESHPAERPRAVLLATDGGPNCNGALDPTRCACSDGSVGGCPDAYLCLDDEAAVAEVGALAALDVPTYVIGIPGVENFSSVLGRMAEAGGTALPGSMKYYLARDTESLEQAVADIGRRAGGCSVVVDVDLAAATRIEVRLEGSPILQDTSHEDGFDIIDSAHLELYGSACESWLGSVTSLQLQLCTLDAAPAAGSNP